MLNPNGAAAMIQTTKWIEEYVVHANQKSPTGIAMLPTKHGEPGLGRRKAVVSYLCFLIPLIIEECVGDCADHPDHDAEKGKILRFQCRSLPNTIGNAPNIMHKVT